MSSKSKNRPEHAFVGFPIFYHQPVPIANGHWSKRGRRLRTKNTLFYPNKTKWPKQNVREQKPATYSVSIRKHECSESIPNSPKPIITRPTGSSRGYVAIRPRRYRVQTATADDSFRRNSPRRCRRVRQRDVRSNIGRRRLLRRVPTSVVLRRIQAYTCEWPRASRGRERRPHKQLVCARRQYYCFFFFLHSGTISWEKTYKRNTRTMWTGNDYAKPCVYTFCHAVVRKWF